MALTAGLLADPDILGKERLVGVEDMLDNVGSPGDVGVRGASAPGWDFSISVHFCVYASRA